MRPASLHTSQNRRAARGIPHQSWKDSDAFGRNWTAQVGGGAVAVDH